METGRRELRLRGRAVSASADLHWRVHVTVHPPNSADLFLASRFIGPRCWVVRINDSLLDLGGPVRSSQSVGVAFQRRVMRMTFGSMVERALIIDGRRADTHRAGRGGNDNRFIDSCGRFKFRNDQRTIRRAALPRRSPMLAAGGAPRFFHGPQSGTPQTNKNDQSVLVLLAHVFDQSPGRSRQITEHLARRIDLAL